MPVPLVGQEPWFRRSNPEEGAGLLYQEAIANEVRNTEPRNWAGKLASVYENLNVSSFHAVDYTGATACLFDNEPLVWEEAASLMDTLASKIAALDEPKPQVMVTDGSYSDHRKGKWLDRFINGQYHLPQGMFTDLWDLWRHAFLVAIAATGTVGVRFAANPGEGKVTAEIRDCLDLWCDDWCGYPMTYGDNTWVDGYRLADLYPKQADLIIHSMRSPKNANPRTSEGWGSSNLVRLVEGWRVKLGEDKGVYCANVEGVPLEWCDYEYDSPPYVFLTPKRRLKGWRGRPILQMVYEPIMEENRIARAMGRAEKRVPKTILYYDKNVVNGADLKVPDDVVCIPYDSTQGPPPTSQPPAFFHQNSVQMIQLHNQKIHDIPGISEMHTGAKKEPGLTAAVAIRAVESMLNERQGYPQRAFVRAVAVDSAIQIARNCRELSEEVPNFTSTWKGQGFLKTIPSKDVFGALDDGKYTYDVAAVSGSKDTPADRLQNLWELMQNQIISGEAYKSIKESFDLTGETKRTDVQRQFIAMQIEKWLDATPADAKKPGFYEPADKWLDQVDAMAQVSDAYLQARMDGAPDYIREFFLQYLTELSDAFDAKRTKEAQLAGVSRGAQPQQQNPVAAPLPARAPTPVSAAPAGGPAPVPTPVAA